MQKFSKTLIHIWISLVSLGAFVFSWALLVHSPKPAPLVNTQTNTTASTTIDQTNLQPIPSLNDYLKSGSSQVQTQQNNITTSTVRPRLRTRGS
jgi:hypothetical protein